MTPQEKADRLNEFNQHLAQGGKLENMCSGQWIPAFSLPHFGCGLDNWRMVPLPRKAKIYVAYKWDEIGPLHQYSININQVTDYTQNGWKIAEIEVTE